MLSRVFASLRRMALHRIPWSCLLLPLLPAGVLHAACPPITPSEDWKAQIAAQFEPFAAYSSEGDPVWVKFTVRVCDPTRVYFQDSRKYRFHYDFARERLDPYLGISPAAFDAISLHAVGQELVLGAVLLPPGVEGGQYGIQLARHDPYEPAEALQYLELVRNHVAAAPGVQVFYVPAFEQSASAQAAADFFQEHGFVVGHPGGWYAGNRCYSEGWALGRLKFFPAGEVASAFLSGALAPHDLLLTDGVPADTPLVAAIMSLAPATPNSHTAILARTFGIPFVFLGAEEDIAAAQSLTGRRVVLRAYTYPSFGGDPWDEDGVRIIDAEEHLTPEQVAEILDLKRPPELDILPVTPKGEMYASTDGLVLGDIRYFGGKAANFGLLRRAIPANSPVSLALSFDLWLGFLEQTVEGGATLREHIDGVLARHTYPPSDMRALAEDLAGLRDLIKDRSRTVFTPGQEQAVLEALQDPRFGFDPERRLRFRSSTNVEDSAQFTGAGLYDSYSGCLADELAGGDGPSICDPSRPSRRGVFRAIRRVFASFYNDGAVLERLRHGLDEAGVGMALLVHHSFPDEIELANGVATLTRTSWSSQIHLVTQLGAVPVTASTSGAIPEEVRAHVSSFSTSVWLERSSNLVLLGQTVMEMDRDYRALADLLVAVAHRFNTETGRTAFVLDFEYKKVAPSGALVVKQVREIPQSSHVPSVTPFLLNEPMDLCVFQGESSNVFSLHRLKSHWRLETRSLWLTAESLAESFYTQARVQFTDGCGRLSFEGILPEFPSAKHAVEGFWVKDMWAFSGLTNPRSYELWTEVPGPVAPARCPIFTQRDLHRRVAVSHRDPVLAWDESVSPPGPSFTRTEECDLSGCFPLRPGDLPQTRNFRGKDGVAITTEFFWPPHPRGIVAGYTAPLARWRQTVIEGLTEAPIVLLGAYSQTYRPLHHNFDEHFVFVPSLEPGLDRDILDALRERDIVAIHAFTGMQEGGVIIYYSEAEMGQRCECSTPLFIRGDVNGDMAVDISDAVSLLYYLFAQGLPPHVPAAGDSNSDGAIDIGDALYLLNYLFAGGPAPAPPFPEPGCGDGRAGCLW